MTAINLTGVFQDAANLLPSQNDLLGSLVTGAIGTVVVSGMKSSSGQDALDPMHWFHHPATETAPAVTGVVSGAGVMTMSQFLTLSPENQKLIQAMKYTIIPG